MRLLSTHTLKLQDFLTEAPPYAILSHTWGAEEFLFNDLENDAAKSKKGYDKVLRSCKTALESGYQWIWIDTCCIDKSSSAELSEAINSMFQGYANAAVCFVYLVDVTMKFYKPGNLVDLAR